MPAVRFAILLSTYNGAKYLPAQLDSLFSQSRQDFILVVRDDGSSDDTLAILDSYNTRYPGRVVLLPADGKNLGASASFSALMQYVLDHKQDLGLESAYMMFCDQDDVWHSNKLELQWQAMTRCEAEAAGLPVLVHSDLAVVAEDGAPIAPSLAAYQGLEIARKQFHHVVLSNLVTGCTAFINEALAQRSLPVAAGAMMHDWWLALVAAAFGRVCFLPEALVEYRQHGGNVIGAREKRPDGLRHASFWKRVVQPKANIHLYDVARQARLFRQRYGAQLGAGQRWSLLAAGCLGIRVGILQRLVFKLLRQF